MAKTIGVTLSERISAGLVVDHKLAGPAQCFPLNHEQEDALVELHAEALVQMICEQVVLAAAGATDIAAEQAKSRA